MLCHTLSLDFRFTKIIIKIRIYEACADAWAFLFGGEQLKEFAKTFYASKAWHDCRRAFLMSKNNLCERCSTPDNPVIADIVHHKVYLNRHNINDPNVTLCWDNLEALCQDCHNKEHHRKGGEKRYSFDEDGNVVLPPISEAE